MLLKGYRKEIKAFVDKLPQALLEEGSASAGNQQQILKVVLNLSRAKSQKTF